MTDGIGVLLCMYTSTSDVATGGQGGRVPPLTAKNLPKNQEKEGENQEKEGKIGKKRKNHEGSFTLPLLTDRAGYATDFNM